VSSRQILGGRSASSGFQRRHRDADRGRRLDAEGLAGTDRPPALGERGGGGGLLGDRNPDVQAGSTVRRDAATPKRLDERAAPRGIGFGGDMESVRDPAIGPKRDDASLEPVAHQPVPSRCGPPRVRSSSGRQRNRESKIRPAAWSGLRPTARGDTIMTVHRRPGGMVVLDQQHFRAAVENGSQPRARFR
jgi:hypothetical protein